MKAVFMALTLALVAVLVASGVASAVEIQGTVRSVDATGRIITLDDGTTLTLAPTSAVDRQALKQGANVIASYDDKDGKKMVTAIKVSPGAPAKTPAEQPPMQSPPPRK